MCVSVNDAPLTDREYIDLAYCALANWALSEDEPVGDIWELLCDLNGVDAETFASAVLYQRRKRAERRAA